MSKLDNVAVCSRSFSKNDILRRELVNIYPKTKFNDTGKQLEGDELIEFLKGYSKAITALETINEYVLLKLPDLKVIGKYGVGLNMIDMDAMRKYGVRLGWTGGVNRRSVSELVVSFMIQLLRNLRESNQDLINGLWQQHVGGLITNRTIGVIGCGNIGKDLIKILNQWDCKFLSHDILNFPDFYKQYKVTPVNLDTLIKESDIVTLHLPLNKSTNNIISRQALSKMKKNSLLINTSRGGLVDEEALKEALSLKKIAGAAFDVFCEEPPRNLDLISLPNFFSTSHIGGSSMEAILAMGRSAIKGLDHNEIPTIE